MSSDDESDLEYENIIDISGINSDESDESSDEESENEEWQLLSSEAFTPPPDRFPFTANPGSTVLQDELDVLEYFKLFIDDYVCDLLVVETNRYAQQQPTTSEPTNWKPVSKEEILIFLAVIILQGIVKKPVEKLYWSKREIIITPFFSKILPYQRYIEIKKNFHMTDNENFDANDHPCPKLHKIWPFYDYVNKKFSEFYVPDRDISIDESLMLYKGRLSWKQYIPSKRSRFGVKSYYLCEAKSGYVYSGIIYTGKGTLLNQKYKDLPLTTQIVMTLMEPLLNKGYCLTTDNFYTSPQLANILVSHTTDTYGTIRQNRKGLPGYFKSKKLKKGEATSFRKGKIMVLKWKDKKDVALLSTIHNNEFKTTDKLDKDGNIIKKPIVVIDYNDTMGGVDRMDQRIHDYAITRKRGKKYYKKIFFHLLDVCIFNSFILYQKNGGKRDNLDYRMCLVERLVESYNSGMSSSKRGRPSATPSPLRLTERHFPKICPATEKKKNASRMCVVCSKNKKRKESRYECQDCNVGLCIVPCFEIFHTKLNY